MLMKPTGMENAQVVKPSGAPKGNAKRPGKRKGGPDKSLNVLSFY